MIRTDQESGAAVAIEADEELCAPGIGKWANSRLKVFSFYGFCGIQWAPLSGARSCSVQLNAKTCSLQTDVGEHVSDLSDASTIWFVSW